jgi:hypothetical protein
MGRRRPAHELPPPPYKRHREHPRTAPPLLTRSSTSLLARASHSLAHRPPPPFPPSPGHLAAAHALVSSPSSSPCPPLPVAPRRQAPVSPSARLPQVVKAPPCPVSTLPVHRTVDPSALPVHHTVDSVHGISRCKLNPGIPLFLPLCKKAPVPQSTNFHEGPWNLKNNSKKVPSLRKIHKNSLKTSKFHIFSTTTPNLVISAPKFLGSLLLSYYAFS